MTIIPPGEIKISFHVTQSPASFSIVHSHCVCVCALKGIRRLFRPCHRHWQTEPVKSHGAMPPSPDRGLKVKRKTPRDAAAAVEASKRALKSPKRKKERLRSVFDLTRNKIHERKKKSIFSSSINQLRDSRRF